MEINWEQRRYEVAKEMLAAINSNSKFQLFGLGREDRVKVAVLYADMLIQELKK